MNLSRFFESDFSCVWNKKEPAEERRLTFLPHGITRNGYSSTGSDSAFGFAVGLMVPISEMAAAVRRGNRRKVRGFSRQSNTGFARPGGAVSANPFDVTSRADVPVSAGGLRTRVVRVITRTPLREWSPAGLVIHRRPPVSGRVLTRLDHRLPSLSSTRLGRIVRPGSREQREFNPSESEEVEAFTSKTTHPNANKNQLSGDKSYPPRDRTHSRR